MKKGFKDFLLEINTEELPAGCVMPALESLYNAFIGQFTALGIDFDPDVSAGLRMATKNTLVCYIKDVSPTQRTALKEVLGPPKRIAFDEKGNPTKQAVGFAKNQGVDVSELKFKQTPKGEYLVFEKQEASRATKDILREIIPVMIKGISFAKTMRWDDSGLRFARPIESVLALFGNESISVSVGNVAQKKITVTPERYLKTLKRSCLIDASERKIKIRKMILDAAKKNGADPKADEKLLEEVTFMVNLPEAFTGSFNKEFLDLPEEVLRASMAKHQRVFPVMKRGMLINKFVAIIDGKGRDENKVKRNYENILEAKLKDSLFFYEEDTKKVFSGNAPQLKDLIFQKDLGNMFEKNQRLKELSGFICDSLGISGSLKSDAQRAGELSKSDLLTHMVGEFPSLQGIMGREYALKSGEKKEVSEAIGEHYLPQGIDDALPKSIAGAILAISDKIDNVAGFVGMSSGKLSGSFDPFGIRRNALGLIRIIKDRSFRIELGPLIKKAIGLYGGKLKIGPSELKKTIIDYIKDRIGFLMGNVRPLELKEAVLGAGGCDISDIFKRLDAVLSMKDSEYFLRAAKVVERTGNILKGAGKEKIGEVNKDLLRDDPERAVWDAYLKSKDEIKDLIDKEEYSDATRKYAETFYEALHEFFDKVLVNTEDSPLRMNRLAMMKAVNSLYAERVADLARLPQIVVKG